MSLCSLGGAGRPFNTGVNVLRVFTEDHHVGEARVLHRDSNTREVANGRNAGVEIEALTHRDIQ